MVVTGHSLGAGTAILATLEILLGKDPFVSSDRVKCIALAPPPGFGSMIYILFPKKTKIYSQRPILTLLNLNPNT